jgi:hypothetical protein
LTAEDREKGRKARVGRREKMKAHAASFRLMRQGLPKMALPLIDKMEQGSLTAAVQLKCLECSCWVRQEVRDCAITDCALYPFRPYQGLRGGNPNDPGKAGVKPQEYPVAQ